MLSGQRFCSLKDYSESKQNLPLEFSYNNLKTGVDKFLLIKFQTCIGNWLFKVVLFNNVFHSIFRTTFHGCFWLFIPILWFSFLICYNLLIVKTEDSNNTYHLQFLLKFLVRKFLMLEKYCHKELFFLYQDFWICHCQEKDRVVWTFFVNTWKLHILYILQT